jgi:REP element-mobilizing transposase RayT
MSNAYKIHKQEATYYMTFQVIGWVDIFTRERYRTIMTDSMNFCVKEKGLTIFAYVIMSNHVHLLANATNSNLSRIVGSMKQHTSSTILESIQNDSESRREWMLPIFRQAAMKHKRNETYQLWTHENHPIEIYSPEFTFQRIHYIHKNPVKAGIVQNPEDYLYCSARDYAGIKGPVNVNVLNLHLMK